MSARLRLLLSVLALFAVFLIGVTGYLIIESERNPTLLDAVYMTTITLSTVGYREVWELSPAGQLWTVIVIVFGIAAVSIAFTSLVTLFISGELRSLRERKRMDSTIGSIKDHIILCGYGRMGRLAATELTARGYAIVVIEASEDRHKLLGEAGLPFIYDDATEEEALLRAGLMRAKTLIATLPHDADNVFITLTAHTLRPDLQIITRAEQASSEFKLKRAGASRVVCPQVMGATRIVNVVSRPNVVDFVEIANKGVDLEMDEYVIGEQSSLAGKSLRDAPLREKTGAIVVAIKRADGETRVNPDPDEVFSVGDTLIIVGKAGISSQLDEL